MKQGIATSAILAVGCLLGCSTAGPHAPFSHENLRDFAEIPQDLQPVEEAYWKYGKEASKLHVWHAIDAYPLPHEFGTYTYVLQMASDPCDEESRLERLLAALISTVPRARDSESMIAPRSTNVFLLPVTAFAGFDSNLGGRHFDFDKPHDVCLSYIQETAFGIMVAIQENTGILESSPSGNASKFPSSAPGPILIASNMPYEQLTVGSELLWIDLSYRPPEAYAQILAEYRRRISDNPIVNAEAFNSFAVSFVSFMSDYFEAAQAGIVVQKQLVKEVLSPD